MKALALLGVLLSASSFAQEPPKTMTKLEVAVEGPQIAAGSFAAKPKTMFRAGSRYCRIEEQADTENKIHGLMIINEPDFWMVNLWDKSARHGVDPGPSFNCKMPIFADDSKEVSALEFGLEMDFFRSKDAARHEGVVLQGKQTTQYQVEIGGSKLALFTYGSPEHPLAVGRVRANSGEIFWYSGYGEVPFDAKLFTKPEGVKIQEIKQ
jgi:hypothetical protein